MRQHSEQAPEMLPAKGRASTLREAYRLMRAQFVACFSAAILLGSPSFGQQVSPENAFVLV
ncbi:MAG: hypothetical protein R3178_02855, partial [Rhodothermales bacterium]|nr:hypothetical protein [Rhodothermales bacterium]